MQLKSNIIAADDLIVRDARSQGINNYVFHYGLIRFPDVKSWTFILSSKPNSDIFVQIWLMCWLSRYNNEGIILEPK